MPVTQPAYFGKVYLLSREGSQGQRQPHPVQVRCSLSMGDEGEPLCYSVLCVEEERRESDELYVLLVTVIGNPSSHDCCKTR